MTVKMIDLEKEIVNLKSIKNYPEKSPNLEKVNTGYKLNHNRIVLQNEATNCD